MAGRNEFKALQDLIAQATARDMVHKTLPVLFASVVEEVGEVSRALLVEGSTYGNTYKRLDESAASECVDLWISSLAVYFACGGAVDGDDRLKFWFPVGLETGHLSAIENNGGKPAFDFFRLLSAVVKSIGNAAQAVDLAHDCPDGLSVKDKVRDTSLQVSADVLSLYFALGGTVDELLSIGDAKMAKWAASQAKSGIQAIRGA